MIKDSQKNGKGGTYPPAYKQTHKLPHGGGEHLPVYNTSPQSFIITFVFLFVDLPTLGTIIKF